MEYSLIEITIYFMPLIMPISMGERGLRFFRWVLRTLSMALFQDDKSLPITLAS